MLKVRKRLDQKRKWVEKNSHSHKHITTFVILSQLWLPCPCITRSFLFLPSCSCNIGVFSCGPKALSKMLQRMCRLYSSADPRGVHFYYHKESFQTSEEKQIHVLCKWLQACGQESGNSFWKGPNSNYFRFYGLDHKVSVTSTELCHCNAPKEPQIILQ